jgi:hypothetical protein
MTNAPSCLEVILVFTNQCMRAFSSCSLGVPHPGTTLLQKSTHQLIYCSRTHMLPDINFSAGELEKIENLQKDTSSNTTYFQICNKYVFVALP